MSFRNPSRERIHELLKASKTIAVIGLSDDPARPSYGVTRTMRGYGYRILPVNPTLEQWEGLPSYPTLDAAAQSLGPGERIDIVNVFRRPAPACAGRRNTLTMSMRSLGPRACAAASRVGYDGSPSHCSRVGLTGRIR